MAAIISKQLPLKLLWTKAVDGPNLSLYASFEIFVDLQQILFLTTWIMFDIY